MYVPLMERKLLASYRSPEAKVIDEDLVDKEGYWTAYYVVTYVLGWHTKLVKREDVPKTYEAWSSQNGKAASCPSITRPTACCKG